jgi:hypothetical protein
VVLDLTGGPDGQGAAIDDVDDPASPESLRGVARRVEALPGVARVGSGRVGDFATHLPGERIDGVRARDDLLEVSVVARAHVPLVELAAEVREVARWPGRVDVTIADLELDDATVAEPQLPLEETNHG